MMRILWQEARDEIHRAFAEGGYRDVRAEHLAVLQYPGPDGERPSTLAARAGMSRQAINHLLSQLESGGYLERRADPQNRNARVIHLRPRGQRLMDHIRTTVAALEREWANDLGEQRLEQLRATVAELRTLRQARSHDAQP
jgi:DNA-binding MarR family transcriptional regulator